MLSGMATGTWGFFKEQRYAATEALKMITDDFFATTDCNSIMVFIDEKNRQSYAGCYAAGFRPQGEIGNLMYFGGKPVKSKIMILEKN